MQRCVLRPCHPRLPLPFLSRDTPMNNAWINYYFQPFAVFPPEQCERRQDCSWVLSNLLLCGHLEDLPLKFNHGGKEIY